MPIDFTCPYCNKSMQVDESYAGQSGPCAGCGQTITIPGPSKPFASTPMGVAPPKPGLPPMPGPAGFGNQGFGAQGPGGFPSPPQSSGNSGALIATLIGVAVALLCCSGVLVALLLPAVQAARDAARRTQSANNMKQIMIALHNYHDDNRSFPPAVVTDASGKPLYSWRVLLLPYLEGPATAGRFDRDKAWDSPENLAVSQTVIPVFQSPRDQPGCCSYMALTGPNTLFPGDKGVKLSQVVDGTANTIAIVEVAGRKQSWAEPKDVDVTALTTLVGAGPGQVPGGPSRGFYIGLVDGSIRYMPVAPETEVMVRQMSTINGNEVVSFGAN